MKQKDKGKGGLRKLGTNIIIFAIGNFASKMMNYFLLPFYTSILSQTEYGVYDIVITTVNLLYPIFSLLITEATMRFTLDKEYNSKKVFTLSFIVTTIGFGFYLLMSPLILLSKSYGDYYLYFVIYQLLLSLHTLVTQYAKGKEKTKEFAVSGILGTFFTLLCNILFMAVFKYGLFGYFLSSYVGTLASLLYLVMRCQILKDFTRIHKADIKLLKQMLKYSVPIIPNSVSWWVSTSSDKYLISHYSGLDATGLYSVAYKIPSLMTMFTTIFFNAWQITAVEDFGTEKSRKMYLNVYNWFFAFIVIISSCIIWLTKLICKILFSKAFYDAWQFVPFLVAAYVFHDLGAYIGSIYTSSKQTMMLFISTVVGALINIVLNVFFIKRWGAIGGAFTTLISYFIVWIIRLRSTQSIIQVEYNYLLDSASLILILVETFIVFLNFRYSFIISACIVITIIILNSRRMIDLFSIIVQRRGKR